MLLSAAWPSEDDSDRVNVVPNRPGTRQIGQRWKRAGRPHHTPARTPAIRYASRGGRGSYLRPASMRHRLRHDDLAIDA